MRNFYYVVSFNLTNPLVKTTLSNQGVTSLTGLMIDFKLRSKLFISYTEAMLAANDDFTKKLESFYPDKQEHQVCQYSVANPSILASSDEVAEKMSIKFGMNYLNGWDDNCCSVIFFADNPTGEEDPDLEPNAWMIKYEILYTDNSIELSGNGDFVFAPINVPRASFNSTYH